MKEAHRLYYLAQARKAELKDLALDFYRECIKEFEEEAKDGSFYDVLYMDDIPDDIKADFEELVAPLFRDEGFDVKYEEDSPYSYCLNERWVISWKKGE